MSAPHSSTNQSTDIEKPSATYSKFTAAFWIRCTITLVLLAIIIVTFDVGQSLRLITFEFFPVFFFGCALVLSSLVLNVMRWYLLIPITNGQLSFLTTSALTLIGHFFNQLLPTSVGGDLVRSWEAKRAGLQLDQAVISVLLDRIIGLTALLILVILGQPILMSKIDNAALQLVAYVIIFAGIVGLISLFVFHLLPLPFERSRILRAGRDLSLGARHLVRSPKIALITLALSMGVHGAGLLTTTIFANALDVDITLSEMALIVPTVLLVASLPISIGGWGVREAGLATGFVALGYPPSVAVAISIIIGLVNLLWALPGAVLWTLRRRL